MVHNIYLSITDSKQSWEDLDQLNSHTGHRWQLA